jgi:hypothetical protein
MATDLIDLYCMHCPQRLHIDFMKKTNISDTGSSTDHHHARISSGEMQIWRNMGFPPLRKKGGRGSEGRLVTSRERIRGGLIPLARAADGRWMGRGSLTDRLYEVAVIRRMHAVSGRRQVESTRLVHLITQATSTAFDVYGRHGRICLAASISAWLIKGRKRCDESKMEAVIHIAMRYPECPMVHNCIN